MSFPLSGKRVPRDSEREKSLESLEYDHSWQLMITLFNNRDESNCKQALPACFYTTAVANEDLCC